MIAKAIKGKGFRGAIAYDLQEGKSVLLETNMAAGEKGCVQAFSKEFGVVRALRPNLEKAVCHVSLSLHPNEKLNDDDWCKVAQTWLEDMGYNNNQYIVSRHTDTEHPHIHILVNRISLDGSVVSDSYDYKRQEVVMRKLEKEHGLVQVLSSHEVGRKATTKGEVEHALRTNEPSARMKLQNIIDTALARNANTSFHEFAENLLVQGVETKLNKASTETVSGISFSLNGVSFKGSKLGKAYTWNSLKNRGLIYENGHITRYEQNKSNTNKEQSNTEYTNGEQPNAITSTTQRTGNLGNAPFPFESTRKPEAEKQRRITESFERLEQEHQRSEQRSTEKRPRSPQLSR